MFWSMYNAPSDRDYYDQGDYYDQYGEYDPTIDDNEADEIGYLFPDRCLMPGLHMKSECHDSEMVEASVTDDDAPF